MQSLTSEINAILYPALPNTLGITTVNISGYIIKVKAFLSERKYKTCEAIDSLSHEGITILHDLKDIVDYDAFVLMQPPRTSLLKYDVDFVEKAISYALANGKLVICNILLDSGVLKRINQLQKQHNGNFEYSVPEFVPSELSKGTPFKPAAKIIVVGSVIPEVESLPLCYRITQKLAEKYRVLSFTTSDNGNLLGMVPLRPYLDTHSLGETERIDALKGIIQKHVQESNPEVILIHIAEAMMEYTEVITQGYGIVPYYLSRIIRPDVFACGFPLNLCNEAVVASISDELNGRYGFAVDIPFATNVIVDSTSAPNPEHVSIVHCDSKLATEFIDPQSPDSAFSVSICIDQRSIDHVCDMLEKEMEETEQIVAVLN